MFYLHTDTQKQKNFKTQLTDNGCIVGFFPESELPQLFYQILIDITNYQWFTLQKKIIRFNTSRDVFMFVLSTG